ncbi:MAG: hypothetical protein AB1422_16815 [bacterium]
MSILSKKKLDLNGYHQKSKTTIGYSPTNTILPQYSLQTLVDNKNVDGCASTI